MTKSIVEISKSHDSVTVKGSISQTANVYKAKFYCNGVFFGSVHTNDGNETWDVQETKTGLNAVTSYSFTVHFYNVEDTSIGSATKAVTTPPPIPTSLRLSYRTSSTLLIEWDGSDEAEKYYFCNKKSSLSSWNESDTTEKAMSISGLDPGTSYDIKVKAYGAGVSSEYTAVEAFSTLNEAKPEPFSWFTTKQSGGGYNILASEWNLLTQKINEVREYNDFNRVTFSQVSSGDIFTASIFNKARNAIYEMNSSSGYPTIKNAGDSIKAADLNTLSNKLNLSI